jgi:GR25 family glycosyltransferase involved in LPS biosynthesis
MKMFDKIFWINSRNRADRYRNMIGRLAELNIEAERFNAIHGGEINWNDPEYAEFYISNTKKNLNLGEKGCFISHRTIYKAIKENGWKKTLILEDDAKFCPDFLNQLNKVYPNVPEYDLLYFGQWNYDKGVVEGEKSALRDKVCEVEGKGIYKAVRCWLTHAYVVDLSIIDLLLDNTKNLYGSIDLVLSDIQEKEKLKVYAIYPSLITQDGTMSSLR